MKVRKHRLWWPSLIGGVILAVAAVDGSGAGWAASGVSTSVEPSAESAPGQAIVVGYTPPTLTIADFYINMARGFMEEAESLGLDVEMLINAPSTHSTAEEQLSIVEGYIAQDVDYLWISPVAFEAGAPMMAAGNDAGIPIVTGPFMDEYEGLDILTYAGFSEFDAGAMQAQVAIDDFGEDLQVAIIQGAPGAFSDARVAGIKSVLDEHPGVEVVAEPVANWDRQEALEAVETIVQANPDLDVVFAVAGDMALGAVEALETSGALHNPTEVVGFDALGAEVNSILQGDEHASVFNNPMGIGALVAQAIAADLAGDEAPLQQLVELIPITADNAETALPAWFRGEEEPPYFPEY
jgi:ribose transport system substrate-binding protein